MKPAHIGGRQFVCGIIAVCSLIVFSGAPLSAQSCQGISASRTGLLNVTGGVTRFPDATDYRVRGGVAGARFFGGVRVGALESSEPNVNALTVNVDMGVPVIFGASRAWTFCPLVEASYLSGTGIRVDSLYRMSTISVAIGAAVGREIELNNRVILLPNASASLLRSRTRDWEINSERFSRDYDWSVSGGWGILVDRKLLLRVHIQRAVAIDGAHPAVGISAGYVFTPKTMRDPFRRARAG